ncbi:MAG: hypothetical protein OEX04_08600 [Acidimicrobiia bacterium]|nr:hypothetical protein [Acidimicrobiia bacterium]MDH4307527.1 hypothetical protein [Acidimicrobiia bacterium]MDH5293396.1 hypothetical protein [Acidimicrobiia bacterium]
MRKLTLITAALVVVACSSQETTPTIPGSDDVVAVPSTSQETSTTVGRVSFEQASLEFTECMREAGLDFPDIRLDSEGRPQLGELLDELDTETTEFRTALTACAPILTQAGALELSSDPELQAVIIDQLASFSECMRTNGVAGFPDPVPGFNGTGSPYLLGQIPFDDPDFETAAQECQGQLGDIGLQG